MVGTDSPAPHLTRGYLIALAARGLPLDHRHLHPPPDPDVPDPALVLAFWRDVFVVLTLLPVLALVSARPGAGRPASTCRYLAVYGLVLALFNALWTLSVALNGAAVATVLVYSSAAFTVLLGWWLLKERLGWAKLLAGRCSLAGCVLVSGASDLPAWDANLLGILPGVLSGPELRRLQPDGPLGVPARPESLDDAAVHLRLCHVFLLLVNLLPGGLLPGSATRPGDLLWLGESVAGWGILFLLAPGPTVAGFGLYLVSLGHLRSSVANLVLTLEPAFTAVVAYALLGERLSGIQIAGSLVIMSGVVILRICQDRPRCTRVELELRGADEARPIHHPDPLHPLE